MKKIFCLLGLVLVTSSYGAQPTGEKPPEKPGDFAWRFLIQTVPDAGLQRLALPVAALGVLQTADAADLRVFNADGQVVPLAMLPLRHQNKPAQTSSWPIYPILATGQQQQNLSALSLRIEQSGGRQVVQVDSAPTAKPLATPSKQVASLIDTKSLKARLTALTVDADLPLGQPVALSVAASKDLKNWRNLAQEMPVFRFGAEAGAPTSLRLAFDDASIDHEYLRLTWPDDAGFTLRGVSLTTAAASSAAPERLRLPLQASSVDKALVFSLPFATPLQALEVRLASANSLVPLRISGRNLATEPWRPLANSVAYRISNGGLESSNPPIELTAQSVRQLRFDSDTNPAGLSDPPQVNALLAPQEIAFVASGPAPFSLALGRPDAAPQRLPLTSLIPGYIDGAQNLLPQAKLGAVLARS